MKRFNTFYSKILEYKEIKIKNLVSELVFRDLSRNYGFNKKNMFFIEKEMEEITKSVKDAHNNIRGPIMLELFDKLFLKIAYDVEF